MCGICGLAFAGEHQPTQDTLLRMTRAMQHRGPDGEGIFLHHNVGLGHRRLSLIDLQGGRQPMTNEDGSVVIVFNGEIYNYQELRQQLLRRGHQFQTSSDTEVLVHLYEDHGPDMLPLLRGMFTFAIYDRNEGSLFLARDRFGIKPLYYALHQGQFVFASEIRPLLAAGISVEVNPQAIHLYMQSRFAHGDETLFRGIHRLAEASSLLWKDGHLSIQRYYELPDDPAPIARGDLDAYFEEIFADAVRSHMIADVPVGAYLSGGVDSSAIVSEMRRHTNSRIRTFCVDFEHGHREADAAEITARELDCDHETVLVGLRELLDLPAVVRSLEEPVGDPIVVAQYYLSRATHQAGIKTVLTGDGADETLAGYSYLKAILMASRWSEKLPRFVFSHIAAPLARHAPLGVIQRLAGLPMDVSRAARERLVLLLLQLPPRDLRSLYDLLLALFCPQELRALYTDTFYAEVARQPTESFAGPPVGSRRLERILSMQFRKWLPSNINLKQDKLCMAHSVENRVPFLDHRFVEAAWALPERLKLDGNRNKVALRNLVSRRLPRIANAPKVPFHLPIEHFLHDPRLWDMVEDNLSEDRIRRRGFWRVQQVRHLMERARQGDYLTAKKLFALVILELWFRTFMDRELPLS